MSMSLAEEAAHWKKQKADERTVPINLNVSIQDINRMLTLGSSPTLRQTKETSKLLPKLHRIA